jgi:hypothetical protein
MSEGRREWMSNNLEFRLFDQEGSRLIPSHTSIAEQEHRP